MNDLRFAWRQLVKNPGFTAAAVLTLALGIGVNTAIFTLFDAVVLRPLAVKDSHQLVNIYRTVEGHPNDWKHLSYPEYTEYRDLNTVFSSLAAYMGTTVPLGDEGRAKGGAEEEIFALLVSGNYFELLGGRTFLGRTFLPEECQTPGAHPVVVLSHRFWERRFGADPTLVGKTVSLAGHAFTVVGVAAPDFLGTQPLVPDAWAPLMMQRELVSGNDLLHERDSFFLDAVARLNPGVSVARAQAAMDVIARQLAEAHPESNRKSGVLLARISLMPLDARRMVVPIAMLIMAVVGLVLLIACANVANLLLARAVARQQEFGIRLAIGASRGRLLRQLATECTLLSLVGGLLALLVSSWITRVLLFVIHPPNLESLSFNLRPDIRVYAYILCISLLAGLLVSVVPGLQVFRLCFNAAWKDEGRALGASAGKSVLRDLLVVTQISVCLVLLIGAGLLARALGKAQTTDPGFEMKHVVVLHDDLRQHGYDYLRMSQVYPALLERLRDLPGIRAATLAETVPLGTSLSATGIQLEGLNPAGSERLLIVGRNRVSPEFFQTLAIPILKGRAFDERDCRGQERVAIVNQTLAQRLWPGSDPIGKRYRGSDSDPWTEVIGLARNTRSSKLSEPDQPYVYVPYRALEQTNRPNMEVLVRTEGDPRLAMAGIRATVQTIDPNLHPSLSVLEQNLERWIAPSRVGAFLSAALGLLALGLAAIGLYGMMAFAVSQRTREIGVRMALGAQRNRIMHLVLRQGLRLVAIGIGLGLLGGGVLACALGKFLFGLSPLDGAAFCAVSLFMTSVSMLACYLPARRAAQVDPMVALRYE